MSDLSKLTEVLPDLSSTTREDLGPILVRLLESHCGPLVSSDNRTITVEEFSALASGKKILAIKLVRNRTDLGLKDAKELVERYQNEMRAAASGKGVQP